MIPITTNAAVSASTRVGPYHVLTVRDLPIASGARPGQFLNVATDRFLSRPFSIYAADRTTGEVANAFDAIGPGTEWLAARAPGERLDVVGPLGHGFEVPPPDGGTDLLVGGGYGSAALSFLAEQLAARGRTVVAILGARTAERVFVDDALEKHCIAIEVTTDDGSYGRRGVVTDVMPDVVARHNVTTTFACGPMPMLRAVAEASPIRTQLAVEEFMACGIGVCWTCVVRVDANGTPKHQRSCTEGPVFDGARVIWA